MTRQEYLNRPLIKDVITMDKLIENICSACHCGKCKAQRYLDSEIQNLRELRDQNTLAAELLRTGELRYDDLEAACSNLGVDFDCTEYFATALSLS